MKKLLTLLIILIPLAGIGQWGLNFGAGISVKPVGKIDVFYKVKNHAIIATYMPLATNLSRYPFSIESINYGYLISGFQPYIGYSTQGLAYGINAWLGNVVVGAGKTGPYYHVNIAYSSLKIKPVLTNNDFAIIGLQLVSGFSSGLHEAIQAGHWGTGHPFWDHSLSWKNKYKDFDGGDQRPAYPGSKNVLVAFTDGYHLTNFISNQANFGTLCFALSSKEKISFKNMAKKVLLAAAANRAAYYVSYEIIFK